MRMSFSAPGNSGWPRLCQAGKGSCRQQVQGGREGVGVSMSPWDDGWTAKGHGKVLMQGKEAGMPCPSLHSPLA